MIWNVPRLVEYASHVMTLKDADLLSTGTPDGVGPHRLGDQVTMEVERVGRLSVRVDLLRPSLLEGGLPLMADGKLVGAIGVSGVTGEQDSQIAAAGVAALK
jgi:hypothetical protein